MNWQRDVDNLCNLLKNVSFRDAAGAEVDAQRGYERWRELTVELRHAGQTIYLVGNGASASMASHYAADLAKNGRLHTQVFSDLSLITAISNDMGYEHVFAEPLKRRARAGDMLIAISSSGRSPNILAAAEVARELGLTTISLSAKDADNPLRGLGTLNAYVAAATYGLAETCHAAILHHWMDMVEADAAL